MNALESMWTLFRYGLLAILIIVAAIIIYVLIMGIAGALKKRFGRKSEQPAQGKRKDDYMADATVAALRSYQSGNHAYRQELSEAFRDGARWGWDNFYRD